MAANYMGNKIPKIAVCLAAYNGIKNINHQIDTILIQKNVDLDIYICVDKSNDGTEEWLSLRAKEECRIKLLPHGNTFGSAAQNFFHIIRQLNLILDYDYIAFSDQDDLWELYKLDCAIKAINNKNVDGYSSNITAFWLDGSTKIIDKAQPQTHYDYMFESAGPGCTFVLTKNLALALKNFIFINQELCKKLVMHDWFIYAFARSKGYKWFINSTPTMLYRQHSSNVIGANIGLRSMLTRIKMIRQGWYSGQVILIAKILGYDSLWPIRNLIRLNIFDRCILALNAWKFRRRLRDKLAFSLIIFLIEK